MDNPTCAVDGCERGGRLTRGWCDLHYQRWRLNGDPGPAEKIKPGLQAKTCTVDGCDRKHEARGLCKLHYGRLHGKKWKRGSPERGMIELVCEWCGVEFRGRGWEPVQRFCGYSCSHKSRGQPPSSPLVIGDCPVCGAAFVRRGRRTVCSDDCAKRSRYKPRSARPVACEVCGEVRMIKQGRLRFCSKECANATEQYKEYRRQSRRRRRARMRELQSERYTTVEIANRDGWKCGICGKRVGKTFTGNDDRAATIDHIVPIADGGHDVKLNVQLAHRECNNRKSHTGPGQLRLVG